LNRGTIGFSASEIGGLAVSIDLRLVDDGNA
jgi:hypothetical protein